ncbi:anti sigma factor C-terminal domain-containing protein [Clostridium culturomicium]|uniref:anti sigma factor C-terminal domain-containing protein n=1 Tax=Clostridium culturomicium TaxID=1499683 RepID=UPI003857CD70
MTYRDKFKAYLDGSLDKEESRQIEEELEKIRVLSDYLNDEIDDKLFEDETAKEQYGCTSEKEMDMKNLIQRAVNKKLRKLGIVVGSIVLAIVLFLMFGLSPIMNKIYYNPGELLGDFSSVIDLPLAVYTELHTANKWFNYTNITPEGYGKYNLKVGYQFNGVIEDFYVTMDKGKFVGYYEDMLKSNLFSNSFTRGTEYNYFEPNDEYALEELRKLPDTAIVEAAVSFPKDLDLKELEKLQKEYNDFHITYIPVRVTDTSHQVMDYFGIEPTGTGIIFDKETYDEEKYPLLELANAPGREITPEQKEIHFKSMLKYMAEAKEFNEAINSHIDYKSALEFVEENGAKTFGVVVKMPVKELMQLRQDGAVENILVTDAKLSIFSK